MKLMLFNTIIKGEMYLWRCEKSKISNHANDNYKKWNNRKRLIRDL